jgi:predicted DNA-binding protein
MRDAQIGFRIRSELKIELERLAKADGRSLANYLERLLDTHVEAKKLEAKKARTRS